MLYKNGHSIIYIYTIMRNICVKSACTYIVIKFHLTWFLPNAFIIQCVKTIWYPYMSTTRNFIPEGSLVWPSSNSYASCKLQADAKKIFIQHRFVLLARCRKNKNDLSGIFHGSRNIFAWPCGVDIMEFRKINLKASL